MATSGATQALHLISHVLFDPGDIVFVENPTYFIATKIFQLDAGLKLKTGTCYIHCIPPRCDDDAM